MDDRKLEVLIVAAEEGSLNKASTRCNCTQSAVTQTINAIEAELGCSIFERSHSGVKLTGAGAALLPLAREAHASISELKQLAMRMAKQDGTVSIGAYPSIVQTWLPGAIAAYRRKNPKVNFDIRIGSDDLPEMLKQGEVDLLLCDDWLFEESFAASANENYRLPESQSGSKTTWNPLVDDPFRAVVPASVPWKKKGSVSRDELFEAPYVFDTKYVFARYLSSQFTSLVKVSVDDTASIISMVANGMGVTVLPESSLRIVPDSVAVLDLDPPGKRTIGAVLPSHPSKAAQGFSRFLKTHVTGTD